MKSFLYSLSVFALLACQPEKPATFKVIADEIPNVIIEARYFSEDNFMGKKVEGYQSDKLMLTSEAITALKKVQAELNEKGMGLKIFDAYRPQRAVNQFVAWCARPTDTLKKGVYYPTISKSELIPNGYIAEKSGHSRGSTVDLTLVDLKTNVALDMGTPWDFFGPESWVNYTGITQMQQQNRKMLQQIMQKNGFKTLPEEWWHFTLIDEPFSDSYFDFVVN